MTTITFRDALSVLSKSSPFSVKTMSTRTPDGFDALKDWLYIEQDIEKDLRARLAQAQPGDMLFLCGSSGDGKSEILTRVYQEYEGSVKFHLDATHSFQPNQSAIEALDHVFRTAIAEQQILVVGINIGMIGNYVQEGHADLRPVREAMRAFLEDAVPAAPYHFFNFEDYPKFRMENGVVVAPFAKDIMRRLTDARPENPFYTAFSRDCVAHDEPLFANFRLLMLDGVQDVIIANIAKARLVKDQFVTARGLLDLLHHLLTGPGYLFDNLFAGSDNELAARLTAFDPALLRTRELDQLALRYELGLPEEERDAFLAELETWNIRLASGDKRTAVPLVRLFYVLQHEQVGNNYHHRFAQEFKDQVTGDYAEVWKMHTQFNGNQEARIALQKFYKRVLMAGIFRYANRNAPELRPDEILLGEYQDVKIAASAELKPDYAVIQQLASKTPIAFFNVALKVGDEALEPMPFNINLFGLLLRLNQGYRPNKYDKNAIVLLDELVEHIKAVVKRGNRLKLYRHQQHISLTYDDGAIDSDGEM